MPTVMAGELTGSRPGRVRRRNAGTLARACWYWLTRPSCRRPDAEKDDLCAADFIAGDIGRRADSAIRVASALD
jgi:hypothetical protein